MTLANKISVCVVGVIVLAVLSGLAALLSCWHVAGLMHRTLHESLSSVQAAEELQIAVMEQRGLVSSYILDDGNRKWLAELERREPNFGEWLHRANATSRTPEERRILADLAKVFGAYDAKRDEVVRIHDRGDIETAQRMLVNDVNALYDAACRLCEDFVEANVRHVDTAANDAHRQIRTATLAVSCCVLLTVTFGAVLVWLFFYGVVFPVRALVAEARDAPGNPAADKCPLPTDEFRAVGVYLRGLISDVADQRTTLERSRQRLRDAEKLASVGKLAASVAHEIRNPLTALRMWLFSIQKDVGGEESLDRKFQVIAEEIDRLEKIVKNFLEFSRPPKLELARLRLSSVLDKALDLIRPRLAARDISVVREDGANLPLAFGDGEQLKQVFFNLLNNAVEATQTGGRMILRTTVEDEPNGRKMLAVRLSDTGCGIPDDIRARIFEPFFSTKEAGTGLGLCIAARITACHEGRIAVESSGDHGTTFVVHIPAATGAET